MLINIEIFHPGAVQPSGFLVGASVHAATGYRVVVCFDAGNLRDVAEIVRGLLPDVRIVICA